jgi:rhodanese-related sulfurtransferase
VTLDELLAQARSRLTRVSPREAAALPADGALVDDIRPAHQRAEGEIPGALAIDRNILEWRLAPSSDHCVAEVADPERVVIVVCNEGYSSSLAAATLQDLGLHRATDLDGGFQAWRAAGLPIDTIGPPA